MLLTVGKLSAMNLVWWTLCGSLAARPLVGGGVLWEPNYHEEEGGINSVCDSLAIASRTHFRKSRIQQHRVSKQDSAQSLLRWAIPFIKHKLTPAPSSEQVIASPSPPSGHKFLFTPGQLIGLVLTPPVLTSVMIYRHRASLSKQH